MGPGNLEPLPQFQGLSSAPFGFSWPIAGISHTRCCFPKLSLSAAKETRVGWSGAAWKIQAGQKGMNGSGSTPTSGRSSHEQTALISELTTSFPRAGVYSEPPGIHGIQQIPGNLHINMHPAEGSLRSCKVWDRLLWPHPSRCKHPALWLLCASFVPFLLYQ